GHGVDRPVIDRATDEGGHAIGTLVRERHGYRIELKQALLDAADAERAKACDLARSDRAGTRLRVDRRKDDWRCPLANLAELIAKHCPRRLRRRVDEDLCSYLHAANLAGPPVARDSRGGNGSAFVRMGRAPGAYPVRGRRL